MTALKSKSLNHSLNLFLQNTDSFRNETHHDGKSNLSQQTEQFFQTVNFNESVKKRLISDYHVIM